MPDATPQTADLAVLVDSRGDRGRSAIDWDDLHVPVEDVSALEEGRASRTVERLGETIVLDGDDRLVSRALTAYRRHHRGRERPVQFLPLRTGPFHHVAAALDAPKPTRRLARQLAEGGVPDHWSTRRRRSLRLTTSAKRAPQWGFSVGVGVVYRLFETYLRSAGSGLTGLSSMASRLAKQMTASQGPSYDTRRGRVSVDYEPRSDDIGYLVATALSETWLGLPGAEGGSPAWMGGTSGRQFLTRVAGSAALPQFLQRNRNAPFERLHVDGPGGYVVDGELHDPGEPHILQIAAGPRVTFVAP